MLNLHCHCAHRQVKARTGSLHPHKHLTGFGWAELTDTSGVLHPLPLGLPHPKGFIHPHIQISAWHWAGQRSPHRHLWVFRLDWALSSLLKCPAHLFFPLLKRIWWIYSFFRHHKSQNHFFCTKNKSQVNVYTNPAEHFPQRFAITWGRFTCHSMSRSFAPLNNIFFSLHVHWTFCSCMVS